MRWGRKHFAVFEESAQVDSFASQEGDQDSFRMRFVVEKVEIEHIFLNISGSPFQLPIHQSFMSIHI
jgi:hypothetical protein